MNKLRVAAGALVALVVAIPAAAQATNPYRSTEVKDPLSDVRAFPNGNKVADAAIDIYKLVGYRYAKNFQVTVTFKHLSRAPYTHRFVDFDDRTTGDTLRSTYIDMATGADGGRTTTTVLIDKYDESADDGSGYVLACSGAKASPNYSTGKVTFTLPVTCLKNYDQSEADMFVGAGRYRASQWRSSLFASGAPQQLDVTDHDDVWTWDRGVTPSARPSSRTPSIRHLGF